jgi:hypothetical protein
MDKNLILTLLLNEMWLKGRKEMQSCHYGVAEETAVRKLHELGLMEVHKKDIPSGNMIAHDVSFVSITDKGRAFIKQLATLTPG